MARGVIPLNLIYVGTKNAPRLVQPRHLNYGLALQIYDLFLNLQ